MKKWVPFCLVALLALAPGAAAREKIIFGGDAQYPPYEFLNGKGSPTGFTVELTRALAEVMGMEIEIRLGPWEEILSAFQRGEVDVMQGISYSDERALIYEFSQPYTLIHHSIFTRKETEGVATFASLSGKKVLVQNEGIMHDTLQSSPLGTLPVPVPYQTQALRMVAAGKYDYAIVANLPGLYAISESKLTNIKRRGKPVAVQRYCYAVLKGNTALRARISEGLAILKNTGRLQSIRAKWLGVLDPSLSPRRLLLISAMVFGIMALMIIGSVFWSRALKSEVALRTKELETRQKQLLQADKMASLGHLVSGIGHELNNPNGLLLLNIPLLVDAFEEIQPILEERYKACGDFPLAGLPYSRMRQELPLLLFETNDAARQIKGIVEDLKEFSRQSDDAMEPCCLNTITANALRLVRKSVEKATTRFSVELATELPLITANPQRIEQVIINLILNACQALEQKDAGILLRTGVHFEEARVYLLVEDEGVGIAKDQLPHITDPFFTTKRHSGGTGLGLSVSAGIVHNHNGSLTFSSAPQKGTTATLSLPIRKKSSKEPL